MFYSQKSFWYIWTETRKPLATARLLFPDGGLSNLDLCQPPSKFGISKGSKLHAFKNPEGHVTLLELGSGQLGSSYGNWARGFILLLVGDSGNILGGLDSLLFRWK